MTLIIHRVLTAGDDDDDGFYCALIVPDDVLGLA